MTNGKQYLSARLCNVIVRAWQYKEGGVALGGSCQRFCETDVLWLGFVGSWE